jgi:hypothetical protein
MFRLSSTAERLLLVFSVFTFFFRNFDGKFILRSILKRNSWPDSMLDLSEMNKVYGRCIQSLNDEKGKIEFTTTIPSSMVLTVVLKNVYSTQSSSHPLNFTLPSVFQLFCSLSSTIAYNFHWANRCLPILSRISILGKHQTKQKVCALILFQISTMINSIRI